MPDTDGFINCTFPWRVDRRSGSVWPLPKYLYARTYTPNFGTKSATSFANFNAFSWERRSGDARVSVMDR